MASEQFGPYRLDELIGRGGMGEVYKAFDTVKKRTVALKRLPSHLADDAEYQARFRREAEVAAQLSEPHIIPIHDFGEIDGRLFIDMRLIVGTDLGELIEQGGPLPPARAVAVIGQLASALAAAHAEGLVHRDVKPSNVIVSTTDRGEDFVHLVDFGIARRTGATVLTATGSAVGTMDYMSPEQLVGGQGDHRVDVYALGCVLYEALTGTKPFPTEALPAKMYAHVHSPAPIASERRPGLPPGLDQVITTAMAKDPDHRYASTTELATQAYRCLTGATSAPVSGPGSTSTEAASPGSTPTHIWGPPHTQPHTQPATQPHTHPSAYEQMPPQWSLQFAPPPPGQAYPQPLPQAPGQGLDRPHRRGRKTVIALAVVTLAAAAALFVVLRPSTTATTGDGDAAAAGASAVPPDAPAETPTVDAPGGAAGSPGGSRLHLSFSGSVTGYLTSADAVSCNLPQSEGGSWQLTGSLNGSQMDLTFTTNAYTGPGTLNVTGITDDHGGLMTMQRGDLTVTSDGSTRGTFTVAADEKSGSVDADLRNQIDRVHVSGSWSCS